MYEADAIGRSRYKNLKLRREGKENSSLRTGLYTFDGSRVLQPLRPEAW